MKAIYDTLQDDFVVWGLGHGGHDFPPGVTPPSIGGNSIFTTDNYSNCSLLTDSFISYVFREPRNFHS